MARANCISRGQSRAQSPSWFMETETKDADEQEKDFSTAKHANHAKSEDVLRKKWTQHPISSLGIFPCHAGIPRFGFYFCLSRVWRISRFLKTERRAADSLARHAKLPRLSKAAGNNSPAGGLILPVPDLQWEGGYSFPGPPCFGGSSGYETPAIDPVEPTPKRAAVSVLRPSNVGT